MRRNQLMTGFLALSMMYGCVGDKFDVDRISDDVSFNPGVMLPLAYADVSVKDILSDKYDEVLYYKDANGDERVMVYQNRDSVEVIGLSDIFSFGVANISLPIPLNLFNAGGYQFETALDLTAKNFSLSSVRLKYTVEVSYNNFIKPVNLALGFPSVTNGGRTINTALSNSGQKVFTFENDQFMVANGQLPVTFSLKKANSADLFPAAGQGTVGIRIINIEVLALTGSTAGFTVSSETYEDEMDLSDFERFNNHIRFNDPRMFFFITNETPLKGAVAPYLKGSRSEGTFIKLEGQPITMAGAVNGVTARSTTSYQKSNSNIGTFFDYLPEKLEYRGDFSLSMPAGVPSVTISNQDSIYLGYRAEIPVEFMLDAPMEVDTIAIDDTDLFEKIKRGSFIVDSENSLPLEASLTLAFYDEDTQKVIDRIVCQQVIPAAPVNPATGKSSTSSVGSERIVLTGSNIANLQKTEKLILELQLRSTNYDDGQMVVLLANNRIHLKVSMIGDVES
ncbi:MAG: hypothetical protein ACWA6U_06555 [Breznakibacter sp.]